MIFHSLDFVVFFLVTVTLYWQLSHRWQNRLLLAASYVFYGWVTPWFLILLVTSTSIDYWAALRMEADPAHKKRYLAFSIASNMGMLAYFKYANFFIDNVAAILTTVGLATSPHVLTVVLPVGISFFTFQALSYTIDVYRGQLRARRSLVDVATFVAFFPQLVAGPIERASHLLPQVEGERHFSPDGARSGLLLMAWGFFKKLVIADNVGLIADKVFALEAPAFEMLWAGVFAFAIQIYADFSAYSDIARGTARWFGFELMVNFDHPYLARGPQDFWRRWHISLSTWFRDYVYIPLGGSRYGFGRELAAILATFVLSGFWHGASWNYVLWGFFHGLLLVASRIRRRVLGDEHARLGRLHATADFRHVRAGGHRLADVPRDRHHDADPRPHPLARGEHVGRAAGRLRAGPAGPAICRAAGRAEPVGGVLARPRGAGPAGDRGRRAGGDAVCRDPGVPQPGVAGFHLLPVLNAHAVGGSKDPRYTRCT